MKWLLCLREIFGHIVDPLPLCQRLVCSVESHPDADSTLKVLRKSLT